MGHRDAQHARTIAADEQWRAGGPWTARLQLAVAQRVVATREVDGALSQQRTDDGEGFLEARHAMVEGKAEGCVLALVPAGAQAQDQAPAADLVDGGGHLGQHAWLVEGGGSHEWPDLHPRRHRGDGSQLGPRLPWAVSAIVTPVEVVVADPHRVEPDVLRDPGHLREVGPTRLVFDLRQLHTDLQGPAHLAAPSASNLDPSSTRGETSIRSASAAYADPTGPLPAWSRGTGAGRTKVGWAAPTSWCRFGTDPFIAAPFHCTAPTVRNPSPS